MTQAGGSAPEVGTLAEEAAKLVGALSGWAREHADLGDDLGPGLDDLAARAGDALHGVGDHASSGGEDCTWCPVCRAARAVRSLSPEVRGHLSDAATSLVHAVAGAMATPAPDGTGRGAEDGR